MKLARYSNFVPLMEHNTQNAHRITYTHLFHQCLPPDDSVVNLDKELSLGVPESFHDCTPHELLPSVLWDVVE